MNMYVVCRSYVLNYFQYLCTWTFSQLINTGKEGSVKVLFGIQNRTLEVWSIRL